MLHTHPAQPPDPPPANPAPPTPTPTAMSRCEIKVIDLGSSCFITDHLSSYVQSRSYRAPEVGPPGGGGMEGTGGLLGMPGGLAL